MIALAEPTTRIHPDSSGTVTSIQPVRFSELTETELTAWSNLQERFDRFESPYFRPEFAHAVSRVRDDVEVAVLRDGETPVGFFPFHRVRGDASLPIGREFSDFHGVVIDPSTNWCPEQLMQACGLKVWDFDHLIAEQSKLSDYSYGSMPSPYIDVSDGFEAYKQRKRAAGSKRIKRTLRYQRKLEREVGPIRFEADSRDPKILETLLEWKSRQYNECGLFDLFSIDWTRNLLFDCFERTDDAFRGVLSVLFVNDELAAIEFGIRANNILHSWFPAYDTSLSSYGLGNTLLVQILQSAESMGIDRIHLGKAEEEYKLSFASDCVHVAEGAVDLRPVQSRIKRGWYHTREWMKQTPLRGALRRPVRFLRKLRRMAVMG